MWRAAGAAACVVLTVATSGCNDDTPSDALPPVVATIVAGRDLASTDRFEVWTCGIPLDTTDPLYAPDTDRLMLYPERIVELIADGVGDYWASVSHEAYRPTFVAGGLVQIAADETSEQCIERASARASRDADAVLVVADAQHASDQPGGRSTPGSWLTCDDPCPAPETGRAVYIGANDFAIDPMPLDLIEHEMGHSLGLPHSGDSLGAAGNRGVGPFDVMADSAAPRAVDPSRRDAPDMLAVDRLDLGWLTLGDMAVAADHTTTVELAPSTGPAGTRLLVVPIDEHRVLTVELLPDSGFDDHLPTSGVVVHLVDDSPEQCGATTRCTDLQRVQQIVAADGSDRTLLRTGDVVMLAGTSELVMITVDSVTADAAIVRVDR